MKNIAYCVRGTDLDGRATAKDDSLNLWLEAISGSLKYTTTSTSSLLLSRKYHCTKSQEIFLMENLAYCVRGYIREFEVHHTLTVSLQ